MTRRIAKKPAPRRPALDASVAARRAPAEAAKTAIDAQAARIAALEAEVDRLKNRAALAEEQHMDAEQAAAAGRHNVDVITRINGVLNREAAALAEELRRVVETRHEARLRYEGEIARLDEMVRQRDMTIAGMAAEAGRLSRELAARHVADASAAREAGLRRDAPDPAKFATKLIHAARDAARREDSPAFPAPTADPVGFGRQPCETGA